MSREYRNRRSARARSRAPNQFLVVTVTFLLGYFTATVCDIETVSNWISTQVLAHRESNTSQEQAHARKQAIVPPKPKFEFYTLLANEKVPNSQPATQAKNQTNGAAAQAIAQPVSPEEASKTALTQAAQAVAVKTAEAKYIAPVPAGKGTYSVQVASFKARQDAEHMKGLLILKGFNVRVIPISHVSRGNWFRVVVGPYANKNLAQKAQVDLAQNEHLRGMITAG